MGRQLMNQKQLAFVFGVSGLVLAPISLFLASSYLGPEPFYEYRIADAIAFVGLSTALIALWCAWSLGLVALVIAGVLSRRWLFALLVAAICSNYLFASVSGYFYDLEHFMLSPEQQTRMGIQFPE